MPPSNTHEPFESEPSQLLGARVLIVEDSWEVSTGLKTLLESRGAEVVGPVATANDARRLVSESAPNAALVDINLRTGELSYGLIDEMRALDIPIVVITGYADTLPATEKVVAVLRKPFSEGELLAALRSVKRS
jgi:CheY-like chemotaxis protein